MIMTKVCTKCSASFTTVLPHRVLCGDCQSLQWLSDEQPETKIKQKKTFRPYKPKVVKKVPKKKKVIRRSAIVFAQPLLEEKSFKRLHPHSPDSYRKMCQLSQERNK